MVYMQRTWDMDEHPSAADVPGAWRKCAHRDVRTVKPYGLQSAPKSDAYGVCDNGAPTRIAGYDHGRRGRLRQLQAKRERARAKRALRVAE